MLALAGREFRELTSRGDAGRGAWQGGEPGLPAPLHVTGMRTALPCPWASQ